MMRKHSIFILTATGEVHEEGYDLFLQFVYFKGDVAQMMAPSIFAQHTMASLSEL